MQLYSQPLIDSLAICMYGTPMKTRKNVSFTEHHPGSFRPNAITMLGLASILTVSLSACGSTNQTKESKPSVDKNNDGIISVEERLKDYLITPYDSPEFKASQRHLAPGDRRYCYAGTAAAIILTDSINQPNKYGDRVIRNKYGLRVDHKLEGDILTIDVDRPNSTSAFNPSDLKFGGFSQPYPNKIFPADEQTKRELALHGCVLP